MGSDSNKMGEEVPDGKIEIFCKSYRRRDGKVMIAAAYGKVAWRLLVNAKPANDNKEIGEAGTQS